MKIKLTLEADLQASELGHPDVKAALDLLRQFNDRLGESAPAVNVDDTSLNVVANNVAAKAPASMRAEPAIETVQPRAIAPSVPAAKQAPPASHAASNKSFGNADDASRAPLTAINRQPAQPAAAASAARPATAAPAGSGWASRPAAAANGIEPPPAAVKAPAPVATQPPPAAAPAAAATPKPSVDQQLPEWFIVQKAECKPALKAAIQAIKDDEPQSCLKAAVELAKRCNREGIEVQTGRGRVNRVFPQSDALAEVLRDLIDQRARTPESPHLPTFEQALDIFSRFEAMIDAQWLSEADEPVLRSFIDNGKYKCAEYMLKTMLSTKETEVSMLESARTFAYMLANNLVPNRPAALDMMAKDMKAKPHRHAVMLCYLSEIVQAFFLLDTEERRGLELVPQEVWNKIREVCDDVVIPHLDDGPDPQNEGGVSKRYTVCWLYRALEWTLPPELEPDAVRLVDQAEEYV